ncbi:IMS-domain-containing protein [Phlebopus sp. FC_14]|nr:IMS-domain-containing protein [Phlebopus sp. FC_14]
MKFVVDQRQLPEPSQDSASLLKRLAGPSSTKAGLSKDQSEINRIIVEVSKGSKFYENEKRKDRDLSERITKILKLRDEVLQGVNIHAIEKHVDHIVEELEAERDLSQTVVHVDMDAFYASVELLHDPSLEGKPFGVGGGVLSTASYEARKYGVRSGMAEFVARKLCPELTVVKLNFKRYLEMSERCMAVFRRYDPNMHAAGCDEGYLNITEYCEDHHVDVETCVREMRDAVRKETQLTVSAGIAPNKMLAKIASDKNKPNGQFHLSFDRESIKEFMRDLPIRKVPGVGRVNERLLDAIGIKTCGDIYIHRATLSLMDKQFGLLFLLRTYLGIASNIVRPGQREERKSIGAERTFRALSDPRMILSKLEEVAGELENDMVQGGWTGKTVTLKYKLDTYQVFTRAKSFGRWVSQKKEDLFAIGKELLLPEFPLTIRLIGLRVTKLKDLRASEPAGGIKRFFEAANTSPRKKAEQETDSELADGDAPEIDEDSMPGFYEEDDGLGILKEENNEQDIQEQNGQSMSGPNTTNGPIASSSRTGPSSGGNVHRTSGEGSTPPDPDVVALEHHACPVCGKQMTTNNRGLNAHIDFCLSKGVIMEAQTAANSASGPSKRPSIYLASNRKRKR